MTETIYPVPASIAANAYINEKKYRELYEQSIKDPEGFWAQQAKILSWIEEWEKVLSGGFDLQDVKWFQGAKLNAAYNCLDRHLATRAKQTAIIWQGDNPNHQQSLTYEELFERVCQFANVLKSVGVKKGDTVCIYLPMIPEVMIAILACARIGAVHLVVFAGFSPQSLRSRIQDAGCRLVITANESIRGNKIIPLKQNVDQALKDCPKVENVIIVKRTEAPVVWHHGRDAWYHNLMAQAHKECKPEILDADHPLFILYTSGSTNKPKGILHTTAGYLVYVATTFKYIFDYHTKEIFWCTADIGWITGHSYVLYGPLLNGGTTLIFEGVPEYPTPARFWEIIDKYKVNIFYTAPTAIRALRREGNEWVRRTQRKSLRIIGTVGEAINPEAWQWYHRVVGDDRCPVVDTWWQTETGGIMISPFPGATPLKPGSASWPFFGVVPEVVDEQGKVVAPGVMGQLIIKQPWPGMMKTIYNNKALFVDTYFKIYQGCYLTGDQAYRDSDGYFWIAGRSDDVIKVSGHRIGSQEVESALVANPAVAEAAVVAMPDDIKGEAIYAYVVLKLGLKPSPVLKTTLIKSVRDSIGPIATIAQIQWAQQLPKTRSGKIMRRLLRKIATDDTQDLGDLSTLADPSVVETLIQERKLLK